MSNEEKIDGAVVEVENFAPDTQTTHGPEAAQEPKPAQAAQGPDLYAVGVHLIKMSPVWLLTVTCGFAILLFLLSWLRPAGGEADAASIPNDAKSVAVRPQQPPAPAQEAQAPAGAPAESKPAEAKAETKAETKVETKAAEPVEVASNRTQAPAESKPAEQPKQPAGAATPRSGAAGNFTVQVGAFSVESQANERISSLRAAGFDARSVAVEIPGRGKWYRVHVGRYAEREEAAKVASRLREKGAAGSMVVAAQ